MNSYTQRLAFSLLMALTLLGASFHLALAQGSTDLSVIITADRDKAKPGDLITFTVTATNRGPDAASLVDVLHQLPAQLQFVSLTCDRGISNDGPYCEYLSIDPGASVTSKLVATPISGSQDRLASTMAQVGLESTTDTADPNSTNNAASVATRLIGR